MKKKRNILPVIIYVAVIAIIIFAIASILMGKDDKQSLPYSEMVEKFENNEVYGYISDPNDYTAIIFLSEEAWIAYGNGKIQDKAIFEQIKVANMTSFEYFQFFGYTEYTTSRYADIKKSLEEKGIVSNVGNRYTSVEVKETPWYISNLPLIIMIILFVVFMIFSLRQTGGGKMGSFGKSKARVAGNGTERVTFANVAGADEEKAELEEVVEYLKRPSKFTALGAKIPHGVLLVGPPGTGKTLLAKAVAGEAGVPFYSMSGSDFVEMYVGVGASRVRDLFENARKSPAAIIFIDEIDAVGRQRGAGLGGGHDER